MTSMMKSMPTLPHALSLHLDPQNNEIGGRGLPAWTYGGLAVDSGLHSSTTTPLLILSHEHDWF
jgi:hypothetical protein